LVGGYVTLDNTKQQFRIEHKTRGTSFEAYIYGAGDRESIAYPTGACIKALGECVKSTMYIGDGKDNDCDGVIDEELFDGIDNDFDGLIDEDCYDKKPVAQDRCPDVKVAQACYNGQLTLSCDSGTINVAEAHFGRLNRAGEQSCGAENPADTCSNNDAGCGFVNIAQTVRLQCNGASTCTLPASQFNDGSSACSTCSLYAHAQYTCLTDKEQNSGQLSGYVYASSSWLQTSAVTSKCSRRDTQGASGDQYFTQHGDQDETDAFEAWRPAQCDKDSSWLQVDIGSTYSVGWYYISGCRRQDFWTTKFAISYSADGKAYTVLKDASGNLIKFDGNSDAVTGKVCTLFQYNIIARYIRIHPLEYNGYPCAHLDIGHNATFRGCPSTQVANSNGAQGVSAPIGGSASISCSPGWNTARGEKTYNVACGTDGNWVGGFRDCSALRHCADIPQLANGYTTGPSNLPGATITFNCLQGFNLNGASQATCRQDGTWSQPVPTCQASQ
jgi:hypothetical protein